PLKAQSPDHPPDKNRHPPVTRATFRLKDRLDIAGTVPKHRLAAIILNQQDHEPSRTGSRRSEWDQRITASAARLPTGQQTRSGQGRKAQHVSYSHTPHPAPAPRSANASRTSLADGFKPRCWNARFIATWLMPGTGFLVYSKA